MKTVLYVVTAVSVAIKVVSKSILGLFKGYCGLAVNPPLGLCLSLTHPFGDALPYGKTHFGYCFFLRRQRYEYE